MVCGDPLKTTFKRGVEMERVFEGKCITTKDNSEVIELIKKYGVNVYFAYWYFNNVDEFIEDIKNTKLKENHNFIVQLDSKNENIQWIGIDNEGDSYGAITLYKNSNLRNSILKEVMTFAEASQKFNLGESTLRSSIRTDRFVEGVDYKKSGKVWIITKEAMERVYGEIK